MSKLEPHQRVADMSVTVRNGRYVIPVRREAQGAVGGIVHDASATGGTLFVEPPAAVQAGNRIRELQIEEVEEVDRILADLTEKLRPHREALGRSLDALVTLDSLVARARFGIEFRCTPGELSEATQGFKIVRGRHPLLTAQGIEVVPFDLEMDSAHLGSQHRRQDRPPQSARTFLGPGSSRLPRTSRSGLAHRDLRRHLRRRRR